MGPTLPTPVPTWSELRKQSAAGQIDFVAANAKTYAAEAWRLREAIRVIMKDAGFQWLLDGMPRFGLAPAHSGENMATKFNKLADGFHRILKGHEKSLTDMIHVFGDDIPKKYKNAEEWSKSGMKDLATLGSGPKHSPYSGYTGQPKAPDQMPDKIMQNKYADPAKVPLEVPDSWNYDTFRQFGLELKPEIPARAWEVWDWIYTKLHAAQTAYSGALRSLGDNAWKGNGKKGAIAATSAYADNLDGLVESIPAVAASLEYVAAAIRETKDRMLAMSVGSEQTITRTHIVSSFGGTGVSGYSFPTSVTNYTGLPAGDLALYRGDVTGVMNPVELNVYAKALAPIVNESYNKHLGNMQGRFPELPGSLNPVTKVTTGPTGPGTKLTPTTKTTPTTNALDALKKQLAAQTKLPTKIPTINPLTTTPTTTPLTSAATLPTSGLTSGLPTTGSTASDLASGLSGLTSAAQQGLGSLNNAGQTGAGLPTSGLPPGATQAGGLPLGGLPAGSKTDAATKAALAKGLSGGGGGGGAKTGGPAGLGGKTLSANLAAQNAARLFPRAGLADALGRAGAGPLGQGMPGSPASPAAGQRGGGQGDKDHKRADYLDSTEHLEEALGDMPAVYKPVVDS